MTLTEAKAKYKEVVGRLPHHTWDVDTILEKLNGLSDTDEEDIPTETKPEKALPKPIHSSLFIPKVEGKAARTVKRENFNEGDLKQYKEAYPDRLKKAMKKLK